MDIYKHKFTKLQNEIFSLLCFKAGEKLNKREISKILGVSPTAIAKALPPLKRNDLVEIKKVKDMNLIYVELNRNNSKAIELKRVENLRFVYESSLPEFLEEKFPGCTVILFGSYSRGEDTKTSDIDIAVIGVKSKEVNLEEYEKRLGKEIIINFYASFKEIHIYLKSNILNGITLSGAVRL